MPRGHAEKFVIIATLVCDAVVALAALRLKRLERKDIFGDTLLTITFLLKLIIAAQRAVDRNGRRAKPS